MTRSGPTTATDNLSPERIPREQHGISRTRISANALKVLNRLHHSGHRALLVGGGVRDLLLGLTPKDFDVATDATPEEVRGLFRNCRLIGRRFRLAHVRFGREVIEVATFRGDHREADDGTHADGRILRDNVFGTLEQDVQRRDFTVNALYYDIDDRSVIDFVGAMADLQARRLRMIGDPETRYREDPVRMLRAVRFAAKLDFKLDAGVVEAIDHCRDLLDDIPPPRLFEEVLKLFQSGHALASWHGLREHGLLEYLLPLTAAVLARDEGAAALIEQALENTDARIREDKPVTPAFLFAAFLWPSVVRRSQELESRGETAVLAMQQASEELMPAQLEATALPRRYSVPMREIWQLQHRLMTQTGKRALRLLSHPRFRAAYDFLCLRAQAGEKVKQQADWWTRIQEKAPQEQSKMADERRSGSGKSRRRRRRRRGGNVEAAPGVP